MAFASAQTALARPAVQVRAVVAAWASSPTVSGYLLRLRSLVAPVGPYLAVIRPRHLYHLLVLLLLFLALSAAKAASGTLSGASSAAVPLTVPAAQPKVQPDLLRAPTLPRSVAVPSVAVAGWETQAPEPQAPEPSAAVEASKPRVPTKYKVAPGDTLSVIAERFDVSVETVMWSNSLTDPDSLEVGEELAIPPVSGLLHTVSSGDNLNYLAQLYAVAPESIAEFNGLSDPGSLQVGDTLVVPDGKIQMARVSPSSRGGRPAAPTVASGSFRWPAGGSITQYFGESGHSGIDLANQSGAPIYAADAGVVVTALKLGYGYGWHLVIDHGNGYQSLYSHMSAFLVDYGERVAKGDRIGSVGSTGLSTGPHLHFEIFQNGVRVNPLKFLP